MVYKQQENEGCEELENQQRCVRKSEVAESCGLTGCIGSAGGMIVELAWLSTWSALSCTSAKLLCGSRKAQEVTAAVVFYAWWDT